MYISEAGNEVDLKAEHINQYIRATSGEGFTAKNFRTWSATSRCAERLAFLSTPHDAKEMKSWIRKLPVVESLQKLWDGKDWSVPNSEFAKNKTMLAVIDTVAADLGNTRAVCRSSYIHPWFLDAWMSENLNDKWQEYCDMRRISGFLKRKYHLENSQRIENLGLILSVIYHCILISTNCSTVRPISLSGGLPVYRSRPGGSSP